ncbi:MAG: uncharacterized protein QOJ59_4104 [Thermomicrobiales bacterium]|jgi:uncharacterized protein Yka (UPF0111/DUF47 family)|nr:uncharacterized protein [Thermomicrobiales bacterium]
MVLARFLPRDVQFFGHFNDAATNALATARLLAEVVEHGPETERKVQRLHEFEHEGDEITHRVYSGLNSTFVTPLDREDIRALAGGLDDFVDDMEEAGKRLWLYRLGAPTATARLLARILVEQAGVIAGAVPHLEFAGKRVAELQKAVLEVHRAENEADDALNTALGTLYDGVEELPALIRALRWGELYALLEGATDRGEDIANTFQGILIKYA